MGIIKSDYETFLAEIKERIRQAQYDALKAVNKELIKLYWDIGKMIVEKQKKYGWGKSIVENLARDLQKEFPGMRGLSSRNLWYMRDFYLTYKDKPKLQPLVAEISWTHNIIIMERCKDDLEREFYIRMSRKFGWSKNVLIHHIENKTYEKTLSGQTSFEKNSTGKVKTSGKISCKR
jgi:predicted nuclease of restriction endonuclease-like (RecB) superfamily